MTGRQPRDVRSRARVALVAAALASLAWPGWARSAPSDPGCVAASAYRAGAPATYPARADICSGLTDQFSAEPTVGVLGDGTVVQYPAYEQHPGTSYTRPALAVSTDGGRTFGLRHITVAGAAPTHPVDLDPFMYVDPRTSRVFVESNTTGTCDVLSTSDDGGLTWATHTVDGCVTSDHENLFAGPPPAAAAAPSGYPDVVYRCAYSAGAFGTLHNADACEKSLDGGTTWTPTGAPAFVYDPSRFVADPDVSTTPYGCMDQLGHGTVGPDGTVYLPAGMCGTPEIAVSHDEGLTWTSSVVSTAVRLHEYDNGVTINDTAVAVDGSGRLYALWISTDLLPYLSYSTDGGGSWSRPVPVAPPGVLASALPEIAATADGRVGIAFMGSSNAPPYPAYRPCPSTPSGCVAAAQEGLMQNVTPNPAYGDVRWSGYLLTTDRPTDPRPVFDGGPVPYSPLVRGECGPDNCAVEKDFLDVRFAPDGSAVAAYVDGCSDSCATSPHGSDDINTGLVARMVRN